MTADRFQVLLGDQAQPAEAAFYDRLSALEVEENADLPGAIQLALRITTHGPAGAEDLTLVGDDAFQPYARIAVVATPDGGPSACIFDGHVLSHRIHVDRGTTASTLRVWGQDVSCVMNLVETVHEWTGTDGDAASAIFGNYQRHGITRTDVDAGPDDPTHAAAQHTLMQRATDAQFLRDRARRTGKLFRVSCTDTAGQNTGYFCAPRLDASAAATLTLNPPEAATVDALDFEWDIARPTEVAAQMLASGKDPQAGDTRESGLALLDSRSLAAFAGSDRAMTVRLTATADSATELKQRAASLLREAGWFVRCEGETDLARQRAVLRAATVVQVNGAGRLHSGKYFVWSVRHTITAESHRMRFVLVRNAVGSQGAP